MSNVISLQLSSPYVPNGAVSVDSSYTNSDTAADIAMKLAAAINEEASLEVEQVYATASGPKLILQWPLDLTGLSLALNFQAEVSSDQVTLPNRFAIARTKNRGITKNIEYTISAS